MRPFEWVRAAKDSCPSPNEGATAAAGGLSDKLEPWAHMARMTVAETYQNLSWEAVRDLILSAPAEYKRWWLHLVEHSPGHVVVETALILFIIWLLFLRKTNDPGKEKTPLTEKEINELVKEWKPEPLTPDPDPEWDEDVQLVVREVKGNQVFVEGMSKPLLNFATFDFLALSQRPQVKDAARAALDKYGCGSCGPRGFYGSIDVHVHCEEAFAKYFGAEEAISYSDSASAVSSVLPAFAKRGDLVVVDEGVHEPIRTGCDLSRSIVKCFKHNDMKDLERVLEQIAEEDRRIKRNVTEQRRFIVVEGLYKNFGDLAPLPKLIELKQKYRYRLFLDQSFAFGCFGGGGRGIAELFDVPLSKVDIMTVSMAHALAGVGGLCVGNSEVVDHQRLSGAGYCFSASAPPFTSTAAMAGLQILETEPELVKRLTSNAELMHDCLQGSPQLKVTGDRRSPIVHVGISPDLTLSRKQQEAVLRRVSSSMVEKGFAVVTSKYIARESFKPPPTLRLTVNSAHTESEIREVANALKTVVKEVLVGNGTIDQ